MDKSDNSLLNSPEMLAEKIEAGQVSEIYVSGFRIGTANSDIIIEFSRNSRPVQVMNLSYTLAKTLSQYLGNVVQNLEASIGTEIRITKDIDEAMGGGSSDKH